MDNGQRPITIAHLRLRWALKQVRMIRKILKNFYLFWAWWPSWSCDFDQLLKFLFPDPKKSPYVTYKFNWPNGFWENINHHLNSTSSMLHTKSQDIPLWFWRLILKGFSHICGYGGHFGHVTRTIWTKFCFTIQRSHHSWISGFRRGDVWKCWRTNGWKTGTRIIGIYY